MVSRFRPFVRQYETHRQLVGRVRPGLGRRRPQLNAIVVPASRPAANLDSAITLARAADCDLVVLCSHDAKATEVLALLAARSFWRAVVVEIPPRYHHPVLDFTSTQLIKEEFPAFCQSPNGDLSIKRNLGLLLGRMLGWQRMFFMDDDIRDITAEDLFTTISMLGRYSSAGMRVTHFPDNSVVCHAHRETGARQDVFISGSVLAVDCEDTVSFFPEIYNEDWLFLYENARAHRLGWSGRDVTQLRFDPFADPWRASRQEFGDMLAEGLYALLHLDAGAEKATAEYWQDFITEREKFLVNVIDRAGQVMSPEVRERMIDAVDIARKCLGRITPSMCERYVQAWQRDLRAWAGRLENLSGYTSAEAALGALGLAAATIHPIGLDRPPATSRPAGSGPVQIPSAPAADQLTVSRASRPSRGRHRKGRPDGLKAAPLMTIKDAPPADTANGPCQPPAMASGRDTPLEAGAAVGQGILAS